DQDPGGHRQGHELQVQGNQRGRSRPEPGPLLSLPGEQMKRRCGFAAIAIAATGMSGAAWGQSANRDEPVPETPKQSLTAIERAFTVVPTAEPQTLFPQIREELQDTPAFLRDSKAFINFRSYYRDNLSNSPTGATWNQAWAAGGWVGFESGR